MSIGVVVLTLPWPPAANNLHAVVRGRKVLSKAGREYRGKVAAACAAQGAPRLGRARLRVSVSAFPPDRRRRDLDNLNKAVLDALVFARVFDDDSQVDDLRIARGEPVKEGRLSVTVEVMRGQVAA